MATPSDGPPSNPDGDPHPGEGGRRPEPARGGDPTADTGGHHPDGTDPLTAPGGSPGGPRPPGPEPSGEPARGPHGGDEGGRGGDSTWFFGPEFGHEESSVRGTASVRSRASVRPQFSPEELAGLADGPTVAPRRVVPLDDEPSALVGRYLFPTERYRGEWKRHPVHLARPLLIAAGATVGLGIVSGMLAGNSTGEGATALLFLAWLAVMVWVGWEVADWFCDRFILTNKRVMVVSGIVTRKVAMMPLARVTDMKFEQSPLGRLLNYGTFVLESAGQDQALREVIHLPNPNELYLRVVEEMYEPAAVEARLSAGDDEDDA
ncbi:hypothetical protein GCM10010124_24030 [Pilimelia terevasa]|uniref:YdbS-like PH domain-containing protein n=1 Tax=Pilimelia terevasa TaxID=53372 RepID=A0A8J3BUS2_9ACTN|nr:PH domain-containing protein [Pilimelia terevasa]GGK30428.1 hypothetical protein GCM10010124_24030 [Pilimelia terevasa]